MSDSQLAFLQNFYTDVTLYVPAEPVKPAAPPAPKTPAPNNDGTAPVSASSTPRPPVRDVRMPSTAFTRPSAGLERLSANFHHPITASDPAPEPLAAAAMNTPPSPVEARLFAPLVSASVTPPHTPEAHQPPFGQVAGPAGMPPLTTPAVPPVMLTPFATVGDNTQGVILLFRLPREQFMKLHRNVFLNKLLQALNLAMADVMLVNVEAELPVALANLRGALAATHIIAFGKNLLDVTIRNTQIYEPVMFQSLNLAYLASATVDLVEYDVSLKKRLWPGLQRMFM